MNASVHKFKEGDQVVATLHDWSSDRSVALATKTVQAQVLKRLTRPFGYNVRLKEPVMFRGHLPLPFSRSNRDSLDSVCIGEQDHPDRILLQEIFIREFDLGREKISLRKKLATFMCTLVFRKISVVYTKPTGQIEYINYFADDGRILTIPDDKKLASRPDSARRLAYKVTHFYGFSNPLPDGGAEPAPCRGKDLHFTMNRFSQLDFWEGIEWSTITKSKAFRPNQGDLICGTPPTTVSDQAPSFDRWFISSVQFRLLCDLICSGNHRGVREEDIIEALILPDNLANYYLSYETPFSRYLYAAIYMLAVKEVTSLPAEWELPMHKSPSSSQLEPFEVWWPRKVLAG